MVNSFQAVAVAIVALLPGALYIWSFERQVGRWGIGFSDRLLRFVGASDAFQAAAAPLTYWLWARYWPKVSGGRPVSWWLWAVPVTYIAVPFVLGTAVGDAVKDGRRWSRWVTGPAPAPRAWDDLFQGAPTGWIRLRLKSGDLDWWRLHRGRRASLLCRRVP